MKNNIPVPFFHLAGGRQELIIIINLKISPGFTIRSLTQDLRSWTCPDPPRWKDKNAYESDYDILKVWGVPMPLPQPSRAANIRVTPHPTAHPTTNCELRTSNCTLPTTNCELRIPHSERGTPNPRAEYWESDHHSS